MASSFITSSQAAAQADEFMAEAVRQLNKIRIFNKNDKYENAAYYYNKAAVSYKLANKYHEAGDAFVKAAENRRLFGKPDDAIPDFQEAAKMYKLGGFKKDAVKMYTEVANHHMARNQFPVAAKMWTEIAEMEEAESQWKAALAAYSRAVDCYDAEDAKSHAIQLRLKMADISANQAEYKQAIELYEAIAKESDKNNLIKNKVNEFLLNAAILHIPGGLAAKDHGASLRDAIERYKNEYFLFSKSREGKFLDKLYDAIDENDEKAFTNAVYEYDRMTPLEKWRANVLLMMKRTIMGDVANVDDEEDEDLEALK